MTIIKKTCCVAVVLNLTALPAVLAATYSWNNVSIDCLCRTAEMGTLTSADFLQTKAAQDGYWTTFKGLYTAVVDTDRLNVDANNCTWAYNCHSYCYHKSKLWLGVGANALDKFYDATGSKCWKLDDSGTVKTKKTIPSHSCLVANNQGKCGHWFLIKNNDHVYNPLPTDIYKQNP